MSKKEVQNTEEKQEKVLTKYDLKVQRRAEEKAKAKKEQRRSTITGIVVVAALVCFVASFPFRSWMTVNGTFVEVAGEKVSRVEFDYNYNLAKNSYLNQYGAYMSYLGVNLSGDLSRQMYSEDLSFQDFFEEMAVESIGQTRALKAAAEAAGFTYDASEDYREYLDALEEGAKEAGVNVSQFVKDNYGPYATTSRIKKFVLEGMETSAYYASVTEEKTPSDEEAKALYEEDRDVYDSVDYRMTTVKAELPTEPTDLADPAEEKTDAEGTTEGEAAEEEAYEPSEAEIEFAMKLAKEEADKAVKTIAEDGEVYEKKQRTDVLSKVRDWLFDSARKAGDTTVIEDDTNYRYFVLCFENRYLDETPTVDIRAIITEGDGAAILEEWKSGAATEESFAELADKYNDTELTVAKGGLYDGLVTDTVSREITEWLDDSSRVNGDTAVITPEGEVFTYVLYFMEKGEPEWILSAKNSILTETMSNYLDEISAGYEVNDPKGNLNYLKVYAARESAAAESEAAEAGAETESSAAESSAQ